MRLYEYNYDMNELIRSSGNIVKLVTLFLAVSHVYPGLCIPGNFTLYVKWMQWPRERRVRLDEDHLNLGTSSVNTGSGLLYFHGGMINKEKNCKQYHLGGTETNIKQ